MKKISLQLRLTLLSSLLLTTACIALTLVINLSANKMIKAKIIVPAQAYGESITMTEIITEAKQRDFKTESILAMVCIILIGSATTYIVVGKAIEPVKKLTQYAKNKNIDTLNEKIMLPKIHDEVYELTLAFNEMSTHLEKSFALQKQFSADAAHELRTPLAAMQAKLEVYKLSNGENEELSAELLNQIARLSKLVDDLLWFSGDAPLEKRDAINITQLVLDMADELSDMAREKQINISVSNEILVAAGNDALLERVFYNLLQNAIKYSAVGANAGVRFFPQRHIVEVWDEGVGIEDSEKEVIFEPFYRTDKSRNRKVGGNGLGLAICKKILEKHGATIIASDNKPNGTVFKIKFPT